MRFLSWLRMRYKHKKDIPLGAKGEYSKINEEIHELEDAIDSRDRGFVVIESADVIEAIGMYTWRQYKIPLFLVVILCYCRKIWKPIRNWYNDVRGRSKRSFFNNHRKGNEDE
jgi:hypothetical protein